MKKNSDNPLGGKSYEFALKASKCCFRIRNEKKEFDLSRQLIRSATSIAANLVEGLGGNSKKDFYYKLTICYKEANESRFWIRLMKDLELMRPKEGIDLMGMVEELLRLIGKSQSTMREKYGFGYQ